MRASRIFTLFPPAADAPPVIPEPTPGDSVVAAAIPGAMVSTSTAYTALGWTYITPKAGTYRFKWYMSSYNFLVPARSQLYKNGAAVGTLKSSASLIPIGYSEEIACAAGDQMQVKLSVSATLGGRALLGGFGAFIQWEKELPAVAAGDTPVLVPATNMTIQVSTVMGAAEYFVLTIPKSGTWRIKWSMMPVSGSAAQMSQVYKNGAAAGSLWQSGTAVNCSQDIACQEGDTIEIWAQAGSAASAAFLGGLHAAVLWDTGY